jgi:putative membrane protein insertion efficiency factor
MIKPLALKAIRLFQLTRMFRAPACRFYPSCSDYAYGCFERHGICCGVLLSIWRILRCHPLHPGGVDEVPDKLSLPAWLLQSEPTKI